jgi:hypothetical protein
VLTIAIVPSALGLLFPSNPVMFQMAKERESLIKQLFSDQLSEVIKGFEILQAVPLGVE